jgi:hypothetical protein
MIIEGGIVIDLAWILKGGSGMGFIRIRVRPLVLTGPGESAIFYLSSDALELDEPA